MSIITTHPRAIALGALCAAGGLGAGAIATAGAAGHSPAQGSAAAHAHHAAAAHSPAARRARHLRGLARRTVHSTSVVSTPKGFVTRTFDRGVVDSVSGQTLTMTDATLKARDHQQTITIPTGAHVHADRKTASLSDLKPGERVVVVQLPGRTAVFARTAAAPAQH